MYLFVAVALNYTRTFSTSIVIKFSSRVHCYFLKTMKFQNFNFLTSLKFLLVVKKLEAIRAKLTVETLR